MRLAPLLTLLSALAAASAAEAQPSQPLVSAGEQVARRNCAECHALAPGQASPFAEAPTFPDLRSRISRGRMARIIEERMEHIHPRMPKLELDVDEVDDFLDFWQDLPPSKPPKPSRPSPPTI